jgi:hypothetical protein
LERRLSAKLQFAPTRWKWLRVESHASAKDRKYNFQENDDPTFNLGTRQEKYSPLFLQPEILRGKAIQMFHDHAALGLNADFFESEPLWFEHGMNVY